MDEPKDTPESSTQPPSANPRADYMRDYRLANAAELTAAKARQHQAKKPHVDERELERLRLPDNRLESLAYGPEKKQQVCLNCGVISDGGKSGRSNVGKHIAYCPEKRRWYEKHEGETETRAYKERWGFNRGNPLASRGWTEHHSLSITGSEKFQVARREKGTAFDAVLAVERNRRSVAKEKGQPIRWGRLRDEARHRRSGPHPSWRKFSDEQLRLHLQGLTGKETAELLGVNPAAVSARARKLGVELPYHRQQRIVCKVLSAVRRHYRTVPLPDANQIVGWCGGQFTRNGCVPPEFKPFFSAFGRELPPDVIQHLIRDPGVGKGDAFAQVFSLAARIQRAWRRSVAVSKPARGRGRPEVKMYQKAKELAERGLSPAKIAERLDPEAFAKNRRATAERFRQGIRRLTRR